MALLHPLICSSGEKSGLPVHFHCLSSCAEADTVVKATDDTIVVRKKIIVQAAARCARFFAEELKVLMSHMALSCPVTGRSFCGADEAANNATIPHDWRCPSDRSHANSLCDQTATWRVADANGGSARPLFVEGYSPAPAISSTASTMRAAAAWWSMWPKPGSRMIF